MTKLHALVFGALCSQAFNNQRRACARYPIRRGYVLHPNFLASPAPFVLT